ncbi:hypothetical protein B296_00053200 [Ensete ventricosum]|uniref:Uncharacterized protein n=1 Tax=Ensete ventricosum TaxID=4639 RepID=A0A426X6D1_ENSVE|nr:hypothetical protein B296_00053200 [Ensete ventricosum]
MHSTPFFPLSQLHPCYNHLYHYRLQTATISSCSHEAHRLTMTGAIELQSDDGPRSSLGIGPGSDDVVRSRRSSLGDLPKGLGSSLETCKEIAGIRPEDSSQECRRLLDWRELGLGLVCRSFSIVIIERS